MNARSLGGAALLLALLAYAALVHYGLGPTSDGAPRGPWAPTGFLFFYLVETPLAPLLERSAVGVPVLLAPALALCAGVWLLTSSSLMRLLAVFGLLCTGTFLFYALQPTAARIWSFFHFRWSGVMVGSALAVATAVTAPWWGRSWLRRSWPLRLLLYLPGVVLVVALLRNVTGTDPTLPFAISPWPVVPFFSLSIFTPALLALLAVGGGLATAFAARSRAGGVLAAAAAVAVLILLPLAVIRWEWTFDRALVVACALALLVVLVAERGAWRQPRIAWSIGLGVLLAGLPVALGLAWADADYRHTRDVIAQGVVDALGTYYEREGDYPDDLEDLVDSGELEQVPDPTIGFAFQAPTPFVYQNFGTSYLLEFAAPGWVQCAYNPPWDDEFDDEGMYEDEEVDPEDGEALPGAWSCPSKPPDLW